MNSILTTRQANAPYVSPSAIEFKLAQHEKDKPEGGDEGELVRWIAEYNRLQGQLHRARH